MSPLFLSSPLLSSHPIIAFIVHPSPISRLLSPISLPGDGNDAERERHGEEAKAIGGAMGLSAGDPNDDKFTLANDEKITHPERGGGGGGGIRRFGGVGLSPTIVWDDLTRRAAHARMDLVDADASTEEAAAILDTTGEEEDGRTDGRTDGR